jgi:superfamily II DNA/RNA helicase
VRKSRSFSFSAPEPNPKTTPLEKLVVFTEHRDTLNYLEQKISTWLGRKSAIVVIHGGLGREERLKAQESFKHDPEVQVLLATDAAGEGINLQRAHLMVNYDLPWNPNRIQTTERACRGALHPVPGDRVISNA